MTTALEWSRDRSRHRRLETGTRPHVEMRRGVVHLRDRHVHECLGRSTRCADARIPGDADDLVLAAVFALAGLEAAAERIAIAEEGTSHRFVEDRDAAAHRAGPYRQSHGHAGAESASTGRTRATRD